MQWHHGGVASGEWVDGGAVVYQSHGRAECGDVDMDGRERDGEDCGGAVWVVAVVGVVLVACELL